MNFGYPRSPQDFNLHAPGCGHVPTTRSPTKCGPHQPFRCRRQHINRPKKRRAIPGSELVLYLGERIVLTQYKEQRHHRVSLLTPFALIHFVHDPHLVFPPLLRRSVEEQCHERNDLPTSFYSRQRGQHRPPGDDVVSADFHQLTNPGQLRSRPAEHGQCTRYLQLWRVRTGNAKGLWPPLRLLPIAGLWRSWRNVSCIPGTRSAPSNARLPAVNSPNWLRVMAVLTLCSKSPWFWVRLFLVAIVRAFSSWAQKIAPTTSVGCHRCVPDPRRSFPTTLSTWRNGPFN